MRAVLLELALVSGLFGMAVPAMAQTFKAEDVIEATTTTVVCDSADVLIDAWKAASNGERTRVSAFIDKKRCVFAAPGDRLRVLSTRMAPALEVVPLSTKSAENGFFTAAPAYKKVGK